MALLAAQAVAAPAAPDGYVQLHLTGLVPADPPAYTITYTALAAIAGLPPVMQAKPSFLHLDVASLISGVGPRLLFMGVPSEPSPAPGSPAQAAIASLLPASPATPSTQTAAPGSAPGPTPGPAASTSARTGTGTGTRTNTETGTGTNTETGTGTNTGLETGTAITAIQPGPLDTPTPVLLEEASTPIPEPASLALAAGGLVLALAARRRRRG